MLAEMVGDSHTQKGRPFLSAFPYDCLAYQLLATEYRLETARLSGAGQCFKRHVVFVGTVHIGPTGCLNRRSTAAANI
ncbi:hypothetical protein CK501_01825 [Halovibrio salipaludis]|uniref:Uncharacterized protein n=1 Tax=Halovibrio salipaludis TaxID=2032626 RepID=A0A2A2FBF1_9GAMM|nr:hypothetical protein CK501_01825 [Halovibrio salipaludis]